MTATTPAERARTLRGEGRLREAAEAWREAAEQAEDPAVRVEALVSLGRVQLVLGGGAAAFDTLQQAHQLARDRAEGRPERLAHAALGAAYAATGSAQTAIRLLEEVLAELPEDDPVRPTVLLDLAAAYADRGREAVAGALRATVHRLAAERKDARLALEAKRLDVEALLADGAWVPATEAAQRLVKQARKVGHREVEADALTQLARAWVERRDYPRGKAFHQAALERHRTLGHRLGVAASLGGLGFCKLGVGLTADAVPLFRQAVGLCAEVDHLPAEDAWRTQLDRVLVLLERTEMRIPELKAHVEVARRLGDRAHEASLMSALGSACLDVRRLDEARKWLERALAISRGRDDAWAASIDLAQLGRVHLALGQPEPAHARLGEAVATAPDPSAPHVLAARDDLAAVEALMAQADADADAG